MTGAICNGGNSDGSRSDGSMKVERRRMAGEELGSESVRQRERVMSSLYLILSL